MYAGVKSLMENAGRYTEEERKKIVNHCLRFEAGIECCEECPIHNTCDHEDQEENAQYILKKLDALKKYRERFGDIF